MNAHQIYGISASREDFTPVKDYVADYAMDFLFFSDIISALNSLQNGEPGLILINMNDFPRHWKVFHQITEPETKIILLTRTQIDEKELNKAKVLDVPVIPNISEEFLQSLVHSRTPVPKDQGNYPETSAKYEANLLLAGENSVRLFSLVTVDQTGIKLEAHGCRPGMYRAYIFPTDSPDYIQKEASSLMDHPDRLLFL